MVKYTQKHYTENKVRKFAFGHYKILHQKQWHRQHPTEHIPVGIKSATWSNKQKEY